MELIIQPDGTARCLYVETLDLAALGALTIRRASTVEPDDQGGWWADLALSGGPKLGPFPHRSAALRAEATWLERHRLSPQDPTVP